MNHFNLLCATTFIEGVAIHTLARRPKPDAFHAGATAISANALAWMVSMLANPLILSWWSNLIPVKTQTYGIESWLSWFAAFTLANAVELAVIQWVWRIRINTAMGVAISLANGVTAASEIHKLATT